MTRLLYLPDDTTVIQLDIETNPDELVAAVNSGLRPLPVLRNFPANKLTASRLNNTVIIAPQRCKERIPKTAGKTDFTRRQGQVLELSSKGFTTAEIAAMLSLSKRTINYHLGRIRMRIRSEITHKDLLDDGDDN